MDGQYSMEEKSTEIKHTGAFVVFIDPTYKEGWVERGELPKNRDALHIGCGIVIREDDKTITLALAEELYDKTSAVMHPQLIHRDCLVQYYTFDTEIFDELIKPKLPKRFSKRFHAHIKFEIADFC